MLYRQNLVAGAVLIVASELMFATMGAAVKAASVTLPNEIIVFMRNLIGALIILPLLLRGGVINLHTQVFRFHLLRAAVGLSAMYCFFFALSRLPLADSMLLKMTSPVFMTLVAWIWLKEQVTKLVMTAIPVGFFGVILILDPGAETTWVAAIGLLGGFLAAVAKVTVRRLGRTEPTVRIVFYFATLAALFSFAPMLWAWRMPVMTEWSLLALTGVMGTFGQLLLTRGYSIAETARVGSFTYFSVLFAATYGYFLWDETLDLYFIAGALLIVSAGILALYARRQPPPTDAPAAVTDLP